MPEDLIRLMRKHNVAPEDIQKAVAEKGYYSVNTPVDSYDPRFISTVLVGAWPQVLSSINVNLGTVCGQIGGQGAKLE